jgi:NADPH-dependent 2,4-dienoyl-CoA reductase/sulfur reductase-like enzyme
MTVSTLGQLEDNALIPYDRLFTRPLLSVTYRARALSITPAEVITDREPVPYEFLVLAMGSTWDGPLNLPPAKVDAAEAVLVQRAQYRSARSVLIVGGGAVGIGASDSCIHWLSPHSTS